MKIFGERELSSYLDQILNKIKDTINKEDRNGLLNVNEIEYIEYLKQENWLEPIFFYWEDMTVSDREDMIVAERFPKTFYVYSGKKYPKQVITYHVPYTGTFPLIQMWPSHRILWTIDVFASPSSATKPGNLSFDIINWYDDPEKIKRELEDIRSKISSQAKNLERDVTEFNNSLDTKISNIFQSRKEFLLKEVNMLANLGVPIKKSSNVPNTFSIPIPKKSINIKKPKIETSPYSPEPTLDQSIYIEILRIIQTTGVEMERHPSIYIGKDEETLRDHIILVLSPHFESVTGETFNKSGKTDILIRHEGLNIFVAECKIWKGSKFHFETIDQILNYLTWRDSKAAIIYFVKNKNLDPVIKQIEDSTPNHQCHIKYNGKSDYGFYNYYFHLLEDDTRGVELAVLFFHFPE